MGKIYEVKYNDDQKKDWNQDHHPCKDMESQSKKTTTLNKVNFIGLNTIEIELN